MYSRVFRNVIRGSTKLRDKRVLKNNTLIFPVLTITVQKILPCASYHCCLRHYSSEHDVLPKDPMDRKKTIDERAQKRIDALIAKNPETEKLLKVLELEYTVLKQEGERVPSQLRPRDWFELLKLQSRMARKKFLDYLFGIEKQNEKRKETKAENNKILEEVRSKREETAKDNETMVYGFGHNFMLRRITDPTMNHLWNWNTIKAMMYGNKMVFDCSYEKYMNAMEIKSTAKQIMESFASNRVHNYPFEILLCNVDLQGELIDRLNRFLPNIFDDDFPMTISSKSYLEHFEKSKLVYLSANSNVELVEYDHNSIYIIGAYVDKGPKRPISFSKAKEEGLRSVRLPLDRYRQFGDGSGKNLTLNQVLGIMLDAQTGDWETAMKHVPTRKLYQSRVKALERRVQKELMQNQINNETFDIEGKNIFESGDVNDFSNSARAKLRNQWNK